MKNFSAKDLESRKNQQIAFELDETLNDFNSEDIQVAGPLDGKLIFKLRNDFILANGSFQVPLLLRCDRCNNKFESLLEVTLEEAIEINDNPVFEEEMELDPAQLHEQIGRNEKLNVKDFIEQYIILNLPTKKLCTNNCINDNIEKLNNQYDNKIDPRWENLLSYKDKIKGE